MNVNQVNKLINKNESMVILCTYNILFTNDIVISSVIDGLAALRRSPYYAHQVKQAAGMVDKQRVRYERRLNEGIGNRADFFADANETFVHDVNHHVEVLYYCIKRTFDRERLEQAQVLSRVELARTLCQFACVQFDLRMKELQKADMQFRSLSIGYLRLTGLLKALDRMMAAFRLNRVIDLNTDETNLAIETLGRKLVDGNIIANAISA